MIKSVPKKCTSHFAFNSCITIYSQPKNNISEENLLIICRGTVPLPSLLCTSYVGINVNMILIGGT
jgi:hypothetical protein